MFNWLSELFRNERMDWILRRHRQWVLTQHQSGACADFSNRDLSGRLLIITDLREAKFTNANLRKAQLFRTDFTGADFRGADLTGSNLISTNLSRTRLDGANFTNATLGWTNLSDVDLSRCIGLETARHARPSSLGTDTLFKSNAQIPMAFLRGSGLPDSLIAYLPSHINAERTFASCFLSHSTKDSAFCDALYSRLCNEGLRVWYAPHDMQGGQWTDDQIESAIKILDRVLLVLSDASMTSNWVRRELKKARLRERSEGRRILFPIRLIDLTKISQWTCLDADTGEDLAEEVRKYHIQDFSKADQPGCFEKALHGLLEDLQVTAGAGTCVAWR